MENGQPDLLKGASAIASHLGMTRAATYHLAATGSLPTFKLGATLCARRSTLNAWLAECEAKARAAAPAP